MKKQEVLELFEKKKVIEKGHFLLSSGRHSDTYLQTARILQFPELTRKLAQELARNYSKVDVVISPALGGIILGFAVAEALGCRMIFTERCEQKMELRRGFELRKDERVLIVEDVITTGQSVKEILDIVKDREAILVGIAVLIDRGDKKIFSEVPNALVKLSIKSYAPQQCIFCNDEIPLVAPGSRYKI